jgi:hypothetical protein
MAPCPVLIVRPPKRRKTLGKAPGKVALKAVS